MAALVAALLLHVIVLTANLEAVVAAWPGPDSNGSGEKSSPSLGSTQGIEMSPSPGTFARTHRELQIGHESRSDGSQTGSRQDEGHLFPPGDVRLSSHSGFAEGKKFKTTENGDGNVQEANRNVEANKTTVLSKSWLTLCQIGRAMYHLSDVSVYSFMFGMSLYYTLVILGHTINLNKLIILFMLGLGFSAVFVVFTILLYAFVPLETNAGFSCSIGKLKDEFHWTTTGPKLFCIVLSICLMTVCTYSFWRLHFPALSTSSETFYSKQGTLKTLLFVAYGSIAELLFLVTQYTYLYNSYVYEPAWYSSTVVSGLKGLVLAWLCCFGDTEVLHAVCCPSGSDVRSTTGNSEVVENHIQRRRSDNDLPGGDLKQEMLALTRAENIWDVTPTADLNNAIEV